MKENSSNNLNDLSCQPKTLTYNKVKVQISYCNPSLKFHAKKNSNGRDKIVNRKVSKNFNMNYNPLNHL